MGCYTRRAMRRWFLIFLVFFLPVQLSWAAAAGYCQHESGATAQHLGHHEHDHAASNTSATDDTTKPSGVIDADCAVCHAGCCSVLQQGVSLFAHGSAFLTYSTLALPLPSPPIALPERPNWTDFA